MSTEPEISKHRHGPWKPMCAREIPIPGGGTATCTKDKGHDGLHENARYPLAPTAAQPGLSEGQVRLDEDHVERLAEFLCEQDGEDSMEMLARSILNFLAASQASPATQPAAPQAPTGEVEGKPNTLYHVICEAVKAEAKRLGENTYSISLAGAVHDAVQAHFATLQAPSEEEIIEIDEHGKVVKGQEKLGGLRPSS